MTFQRTPIERLSFWQLTIYSVYIVLTFTYLKHMNGLEKTTQVLLGVIAPLRCPKFNYNIDMKEKQKYLYLFLTKRGGNDEGGGRRRKLKKLHLLLFFCSTKQSCANMLTFLNSCTCCELKDTITAIPNMVKEVSA